MGMNFINMLRNLKLENVVTAPMLSDFVQGLFLNIQKFHSFSGCRLFFIVCRGRGGISALELQRILKMKSYGTIWTMLHKIREALRQKDLQYKLSNYIKLDGASFGKKVTGNQVDVLIAIETKDWIDAKGQPKSKAGFAKVIIGAKTKQNARNFVNANVNQGAMLNTDGSPSLRNLTGMDVDYRVAGANKEILDHCLPWVHKFISNAKAWLIGTHHGVDSKYLAQYLAEYTATHLMRDKLSSQ